MKEIVELKLKGLKNREIAGRLGISESAVSQTLHGVADKVQTLSDSLEMLEELGLWRNEEALRLLMPSRPSRPLKLPQHILVTSPPTMLAPEPTTEKNLHELIQTIVLDKPFSQLEKRYSPTEIWKSSPMNVFAPQLFKEVESPYRLSEPATPKMLQRIYA
jgi:transcriptional regulator with XRE-family HTH domain